MSPSTCLPLLPVGTLQAHAAREAVSLGEQLEARRLAEAHAAAQASLVAQELEGMERHMQQLHQEIQVSQWVGRPVT